MKDKKRMKDSCADMDFELSKLYIVRDMASVVDGGVSESNPVLPHVELSVVGTCENNIYFYFC
jgi:hypothetical protein